MGWPPRRAGRSRTTSSPRGGGLEPRSAPLGPTSVRGAGESASRGVPLGPSALRTGSSPTGGARRHAGSSSIQKPSTRTRCAGPPSGQPRSESVPIVNSPPPTHTIPGGPSAGDCASRLRRTRAKLTPKVPMPSAASRSERLPRVWARGEGRCFNGPRPHPEPTAGCLIRRPLPFLNSGRTESWSVSWAVPSGSFPFTQRLRLHSAKRGGSPFGVDRWGQAAVPHRDRCSTSLYRDGRSPRTVALNGH